MRMYKFYGDDALELLRENPYILATSHIGGRFSEADSLALEMGLDGNSRNRINAAALFLSFGIISITAIAFIPREKLAAVTADLYALSRMRSTTA